MRRGGVAQIMTRSHLLQFVDGQQKKREGVSEVLFNLQSVVVVDVLPYDSVFYSSK